MAKHARGVQKLRSEVEYLICSKIAFLGPPRGVQKLRRRVEYRHLQQIAFVGQGLNRTDDAEKPRLTRGGGATGGRGLGMVLLVDRAALSVPTRTNRAAAKPHLTTWSCR
jgi:hypothetical protein